MRQPSSDSGVFVGNHTSKGDAAGRRHRYLAVLFVLVVASSCLAFVSPELPTLKSIQRMSPPMLEATHLDARQRSDQYVWVALEDARRIAKVDLRKRRVVRKLKVAGNPHNIAVNGAGLVATTLWGDDRVALIKGRWRKGVKIAGAPHDVKIGGDRVVIANQGAARLNVLSLKGKKRGYALLKANPHDVALTPSAHKAWASLEGSDDLAVINLRRKKVKRYVSTGKSPHDLLFSPDGRLWVTDWNGAFHVFSRKGKLLRSRSLGEEAHHLAFTPDGRQVWITDHAAHRVFVVSTRKYKVLKRISIAGSPHHVSITSDGKKAAVADHDRGLLIIYRVATRTRLAKIAVGAGPHGVWAVP
jgi:DNA-binding beta-propeller fold protein YncE